jgi:uncharacterized protein YciI
MAYFVVVMEAGPAWNPSRPRREQENWREHAAFIDSLAAEHFLLLVGPLSPTRALEILDAPSEQSVRTRLKTDPWVRVGTLRILSVDPWEVLIGKERLAGGSLPTEFKGRAERSGPRRRAVAPDRTP